VTGSRNKTGPASVSPGHVAIVGLGPTCSDYLHVTRCLGGRQAFCDQVWAINALGGVLDCDLVFHMDDVRIQERRARADPAGNIAAMLKWMRRYPGRIVTSRPHPRYRSLEAFPLQELLDDTGSAYLNSTGAYAVAYAVLKRATRLSLFGIDYSYAHSHDAERGRACFEFWLGVAHARGIQIAVPNATPLMDSNVPKREKLYGYDTLDVSSAMQGKRRVLSFAPRARIATAAEIEARYDHSRPVIATPSE
jgi:hypothetical protein